MKMTPMTYYTTLRSEWHYRPAVAALATLAWFCEAGDYWQRAQKISDFMATRLPEDRQSNAVERHHILADDQPDIYGAQNMVEEDLCADCTHLAYRIQTWGKSDCQLVKHDSWPCQVNSDGYAVACPHFVPIGGTGDNYV